MMKVGIDGIAHYVPNLYLPIKTLAEQRGIEPAKLEKGLGLKKMSVIDVYEDTATLAANSLLHLFEQENLNPKEIHRIYVGTESGLDSSKPVATYAMQLVESVIEKDFGANSLQHVDAVDLTFACVGAIDALQNCLDFVRCNPTKKAIVIASDYAKYKLDSTGEYTQGAGAVALLVSANPSILAVGSEVGISTESVYDFFKPRRYFEEDSVRKATQSSTKVVEVYSDEPIFDGQYSNDCYQARLKGAYFDLKEQLNHNGRLFDDWKILAFHLPYAYQARRMFSEIYALENKVEDLSKENLKAISKSEEYRAFVQEKIEPTERASSDIGNMYTGSIFMALLSALEVNLLENIELIGKKVGFLAYGSGSKSKVFQGEIQQGWKEKIEKVKLFQQLENRTEIDYQTYESLHRKQLSSAVTEPKGFALTKIEKENPNLLGARYYSYL